MTSPLGILSADRLEAFVPPCEVRTVTGNATTGECGVPAVYVAAFRCVECGDAPHQFVCAVHFRHLNSGVPIWCRGCGQHGVQIELTFAERRW